MFTELLGYAASLFVVVSLLMSDMKLLRYVNFVGCFLFVIYGLMISAYPVALMNGTAMMINVYYIVKLHREAKS